MSRKDLESFSLILPVPYEGDFYDRNNLSAQEFKKFLRAASGDILKSNQLGQLASGLVHGKVYRICNQPDHGLYEIAEFGRGITFHDPKTLYNNWSDAELKVGETMQSAMRNIIDYALSTRELAPR